jgi:glycosyltransferase involved in cell wall biosynthesis
MTKLSKRVIVIGPLSPPITGQSELFDSLIEHLVQEAVPYAVINTAPPALYRFGWSTQLHRFFLPFYLGAKASRLLFIQRSTLYLTIATSWHGFFRDLLFISIGRIGNHRIVAHCHSGNYGSFYNSANSLGQWLIKTVLSRLDRLIILSALFRDDFSFLWQGRVSIKVVANGFSLPHGLFSPSKDNQLARPLTKEGKPSLRILFLSNLIESKGYLALLEAVSFLINDHCLTLSAHFCGEFMLLDAKSKYSTTHDARNDFTKRVTEFGLDDVVVLHGPIRGAEKYHELIAADIFILPTSYPNEAQPLSIIEAMACQCAIVSTDYRGIPELLNYGQAGVLMEAPSSRNIASAVLQLHRSNSLLTKYKNAAFDHYLHNYQKSAYCQNLLQELRP